MYCFVVCIASCTQFFEPCSEICLIIFLKRLPSMAFSDHGHFLVAGFSFDVIFFQEVCFICFLFFFVVVA